MGINHFSHQVLDGGKSGNGITGIGRKFIGEEGAVTRRQQDPGREAVRVGEKKEHHRNLYLLGSAF